jgi:outer membrane protein OmpA-like peptidoglycan-associated protein
LSAAKHIQLDTTQSTFTIRCHLSAGPLTRCSVSLRHRDTTVATGTSTTSIVHLHLTRAGIELLVASLRDLSATITATAVPIAGSVSATTATTIVIHTQSITTPAQAFSQGATTLSLAGLRNVAALAHRIGQAKTILCNGDAANLGSRVVPSSQAISKARAAAVCDQLGRDGVHAVYIIAAKATRSPAASTRTPAGQAANRLVEVTITHAS